MRFSVCTTRAYSAKEGDSQILAGSGQMEELRLRRPEVWLGETRAALD